MVVFFSFNILKGSLNASEMSGQIIVAQSQTSVLRLTAQQAPFSHHHLETAPSSQQLSEQEGQSSPGIIFFKYCAGVHSISKVKH
jgi:hypothetical protein